MPSHKQKKDRKKSHKRKHRSHSHSSIRRHKIHRKSEGKKENIPRNPSTWNVDLKDISTYMENRRDMIREIFSSVGEDFLNLRVPLILKQTTREDLRKMCYEELTKMSADIVFKILEGIPEEMEPKMPGVCPRKRMHECKSCKKCCRHSSKTSSFEQCSKIGKYSEEKHLALHKGKYEGPSCNERKRERVVQSSSEESQSDSESDKKKCSADYKTKMTIEAPSTSYQASATKKLAKVAPFHISIPKPEVPQPAVLDEEEGVDSNELDSESSYEMVDLGLEEDIEDEENESDTQEVAIDEVSPHVSSHNENSGRGEMTEEERQQNLSEVIELEHRARAIRSMLANIDRVQA